MNEIVIHPNKNFLDPRNPSSPFQYRQQMAESCWKYIQTKAVVDSGLWHLKINNGIHDCYYWEKTKEDLFNAVKHHFTILL